MSGRNFTRREALGLFVGAGAMLATASFFKPQRVIAALPDSDKMTVKYNSDHNVDDGVLGHYHVNVDGVTVICPHAGVPVPKDGTYTAYDLDSHLELLEDPFSGGYTPRHSAAKVLELWKMFAYYGWNQPGYSESWWRNAIEDAGIRGSVDKWRISTIMHCGMSYYWVGVINGFFLDSAGLKKLYKILREKNEADGNPSEKVRMFMIDGGSGHQEVVFWDFSGVVMGKLSVKKIYEGDTNRVFHFKVTYSGSKAPAADEFTLKAGQTWTSEDIPKGVKYAVTETESSAYDVTWINRTGTIEANKTATVTCENKSGHLQLEKDVTD